MKTKEEIIREKLLPILPYMTAPKNVQWEKMFKMFEDAMEEYATESKKEIIEGLEKMSNEYEIAGGGEYVVMKLTLDHYIEKL